MSATALEQAGAEPARELVTIMPRRRDTPVGVETIDPIIETPSPPLPATPPPLPATPPPIAKTPPPTPAPRGAQPAVARARTRGPGPAASVMLVLATLLAAATAFMYCSRRHSHTAVVGDRLDAGPEQVVVMTPPDDAAVRLAVPRDAASAPPADAAKLALSPQRDAAVVASTLDAGANVDAGVDRVKAAKDLFDKAHSALEDGDAEQALDYANQSLKLRRTARTLLERARALQRLDRIDEALTSVDDALAIASDYAPAYEQRALILWSARRYDEAKQAMKKYIELDPNGRSVDAFKDLLEKPQ